MHWYIGKGISTLRFIMLCKQSATIATTNGVSLHVALFVVVVVVVRVCGSNKKLGNDGCTVIVPNLSVVAAASGSRKKK